MRFATRPLSSLHIPNPNPDRRSYAIATPTSTRSGHDTSGDDTLALSALAWLLTDDTRAARFLNLTGLDPDDLRARAASEEVAAATLGFLQGHEPDLLACAEALGVPPSRLAAGTFSA